MHNYTQFINGSWQKSTSTDVCEIINPSNESIVGSVAVGDLADVEKAMQAAHKAQIDWKKLPARKRAEALQLLVEKIKSKREWLAELLVQEQGKLLKVARMEVDVTCSFIEYACEWARRIEGDIVASDNPNEQLYIHKVPRGVVVAITAWNFPLALAGRKLGPALVAGNTIVIKPTMETPLATMELGNLANEAGIPAGVINIVTGSGRVMGDALVRHPLTKMISMTGSTRAGQEIFKAAADKLAHVQLELGGKAPFIVLEDADLERAASAAVGARFDNCGQVCTCNERMYIHEEVYDDFMAKFLPKVEALRVGNPMLDSSDMGPKVNKSEVEHMEELVSTSLMEGASLALGGKRPTGKYFEKGFWFEPTILTNVSQEMTIVHEESFGPILPVIKIKDLDQAIEFANDCEFGLSAYLFTKDMKNIMRCNDELEFGEIYVNRSHGEQHQGFHNGYKLSGTGGEDGRYGFEQYLDKKTSYIDYN